MNIIAEYSDIDISQWHKLLEMSPTASWFQSPAAYEFFAAVPTVMKPFVYAVERDKLLKGVVVGFITVGRNRIIDFFSRRAIVYAGPLLAADIKTEELKELLNTVILKLKHQSIYVEMRNFSDYSRWKTVFEEAGFRYNEHYDMHIDCSSREIMLSNLTESKLRQIRKSQKDNLEVHIAETEAEVEIFYNLLSDLYKSKVRLPLFPIEFFRTFVLNNVGQLILLEQNGKVIGGMLCPILEQKIIYEWYVVGPTEVTWAVMNYALEHHIPLFDLMGAGEPNVPYGVRDFKMQMGGKLHDFGRYIIINNQCLYRIGKQIIKLRQKI